MYGQQAQYNPEKLFWELDNHARYMMSQFGWNLAQLFDYYVNMGHDRQMVYNVLVRYQQPQPMMQQYQQPPVQQPVQQQQPTMQQPVAQPVQNVPQQPKQQPVQQKPVQQQQQAPVRKKPEIPDYVTHPRVQPRQMPPVKKEVKKTPEELKREQEKRESDAYDAYVQTLLDQKKRELAMQEQARQAQIAAQRAQQQQPPMQQPVYQQPIMQQPVYQQPVMQQPVYQYQPQPMQMMYNYQQMPPQAMQQQQQAPQGSMFNRMPEHPTGPVVKARIVDGNGNTSIHQMKTPPDRSRSKDPANEPQETPLFNKAPASEQSQQLKAKVVQNGQERKVTMPQSDAHMYQPGPMQQQAPISQPTYFDWNQPGNVSPNPGQRINLGAPINVVQPQEQWEPIIPVYQPAQHQQPPQQQPQQYNYQSIAAEKYGNGAMNKNVDPTEIDRKIAFQRNYEYIKHTQTSRGRPVDEDAIRMLTEELLKKGVDLAAEMGYNNVLSAQDMRKYYDSNGQLLAGGNEAMKRDIIDRIAATIPPKHPDYNPMAYYPNPAPDKLPYNQTYGEYKKYQLGDGRTYTPFGWFGNPIQVPAHVPPAPWMIQGGYGYAPLQPGDLYSKAETRMYPGVQPNHNNPYPPTARTGIFAEEYLAPNKLYEEMYGTEDMAVQKAQPRAPWEEERIREMYRQAKHNYAMQLGFDSLEQMELHNRTTMKKISAIVCKNLGMSDEETRNHVYELYDKPYEKKPPVDEAAEFEKMMKEKEEFKRRFWAPTTVRLVRGDGTVIMEAKTKFLDTAARTDELARMFQRHEMEKQYARMRLTEFYNNSIERRFDRSSLVQFFNEDVFEIMWEDKWKEVRKSNADMLNQWYSRNDFIRGAMANYGPPAAQAKLLEEKIRFRIGIKLMPDWVQGGYGYYANGEPVSKDLDPRIGYLSFYNKKTGKYIADVSPVPDDEIKRIQEPFLTKLGIEVPLYAEG